MGGEPHLAMLASYRETDPHVLVGGFECSSYMWDSVLPTLYLRIFGLLSSSHIGTMAIEQRKDTTPDDNKMHVTSVLAQQHEHAILDQDATTDEQTLGALGYKQEFKRCDHGYELVPLSRHPAIPQPQNIQPYFPLYSDVPAHAFH